MESFLQTLGQNVDPGKKCRVAIPFAQDEACAYAVDRALQAGMIVPVLIGNGKEIEAMYGDCLRGKEVLILEEADPEKACKLAVRMIREGNADILMKGLVPTSVLLKAVLNSQDGIKKNPLLSHLCYFEVPNKPGMKILSDAAISIAPDAETLARIVENAVESFSLFSKNIPKVALLAANEKVSDKIPSTCLAKEVADLLKDRSDMIVEGPISLDLAVSHESVQIKKYGGRIQGDADIFIVPRVEVGNVFYKSLQYFSRASMAGVVYGAQCPVVLTSRSDSNDTKFYSLVLGVIMGSRQAARVGLSREASR